MKNAKKITSVLIMASMSMLMLASCGLATGATTTNTTNTTNTQSSQTRKFDPTSMKTLYTNTLKNLVTAGTITQAQSDKVLEAVTKNVPQGAGGDRTKRSAKKNTANPSATRPKNNELTALVTSGVITQAQADTINTKISQSIKVNRSNQAN